MGLGNLPEKEGRDPEGKTLQGRLRARVAVPGLSDPHVAWRQGLLRNRWDAGLPPPQCPWDSSTSTSVSKWPLTRAGGTESPLPRVSTEEGGLRSREQAFW